VLIKKILVFFGQILSGSFFIEFDTHARFIPDLYEPVFDNRFWKTFDYIIPPFGSANRIFKGDVILGQGCGYLNECSKTYKTVAGTVRSYKNAVQVGIFSYPFKFCYASYRWRIPLYFKSL